MITGITRAFAWTLLIAFLVWALRIVVIEGYLFPIATDFVGDFTRTADLGAPTWFNGQGIFYGPIFVLEYRFLLSPGWLSGGDFARLDFALFGIAFVCTWLALFGARRFLLAVLVLALWLAHHATVEAFSNTAHLEVLELTFLCAALLLAVRARPGAAGVMIGLATATKTLPALFIPYLALKRQWRMLSGAVITATVLFLLVCWLQQVSILDGFISLIYQGGNLTKLEYTEYEYSPRADVARILAGDGGVLTSDQARLAIGAHWLLAGLTLVLTAWALRGVPLNSRTYGATFGLIMAVMLVVAPSAHIPYYIFLLPGWTAVLAELVLRNRSPATPGLWFALVVSYVFTGFDQPFFVLQRVVGFGIVVPQNWLPWHLPTLGLLLSVATLAVVVRTAPALDSALARGLSKQATDRDGVLRAA